MAFVCFCNFFLAIHDIHVNNLCTLRYVHLTHLCRVDSSTSTLWTDPLPVEGVVDSFLLLPCCIEICLFNANSVDSDQTPRSVASDLGLHCLPMSL